jgi:hypothetical protein
VGNVAHTRNDPLAPIDGTRGAFFYAPLSISSAGNYTVLVKFDLDEGTAGTRPSVAGQIDNVAITPNALFRPPSVPEPASFGLLAIAAVGLLRRR